MKCVEDDLEGDIRDVGQWKRMVGALFSVRAQRLSDKRQLDLDADAQTRISSDIDQQLQANAFTIAALMTDNLPVISRQRWTFQRNERWFEDMYLAPFGRVLLRASLSRLSCHLQIPGGAVQ
ncbi:hypothetical protein ISCGN_032468, partial [Ixodes scapularis]